MRPSLTRKKLRSDLLHSDLGRHIARYMYDERMRTYLKCYKEQNNKDPSKEELVAFYEIAKGDLRKAIDEILGSFLERCIPESDAVYFAKNITLFSTVTVSSGVSLFIAALTCVKSLFPGVEISYSIGLQDYISVGVAIGLWAIIAIYKAVHFIRINT